MEALNLTAVSRKVAEIFSIELSDLRLREINEERKVLYAPFLDISNQGLLFLALVGVDQADQTAKEFIFEYNLSSGNITIALVSCQISYEDIALSDCVEYCFKDEEPFPVWHIAQVSRDSIVQFKQSKFKLWENLLKAPECEAAFRRLLQAGPIRTVFEKFIFTTPDSLISKYKVTDETTGKSVDLPHQVDRMRIWNAERGEYEDFDAKLDGAPDNDHETQIYWNNLLEELRSLRGADYINSLL